MITAHPTGLTADYIQEVFGISDGRDLLGKPAWLKLTLEIMARDWFTFERRPLVLHMVKSLKFPVGYEPCQVLVATTLDTLYVISEDTLQQWAAAGIFSKGSLRREKFLRLVKEGV